jgi:hypothetical protein
MATMPADAHEITRATVDWTDVLRALDAEANEEGAYLDATTFERFSHGSAYDADKVSAYAAALKRTLGKMPTLDAIYRVASISIDAERFVAIRVK